MVEQPTDDPRVHAAWSTLDDAGRWIKLRHHLSLSYPVPAAWVAWLLEKYESRHDCAMELLREEKKDSDV